MVIDATEALTIIAQIAIEAQTSGLVPGGTPSLLLTAFVAGLQATLQSGVLTPRAPIEIDDVGDDMQAAVIRLRAAEPR